MYWSTPIAIFPRSCIAANELSCPIPCLAHKTHSATAPRTAALKGIDIFFSSELGDVAAPRGFLIVRAPHPPRLGLKFLSLVDDPLRGRAPRAAPGSGDWRFDTSRRLRSRWLPVGRGRQANLPPPCQRFRAPPRARSASFRART